VLRLGGPARTVANETRTETTQDRQGVTSLGVGGPCAGTERSESTVPPAWADTWPRLLDQAGRSVPVPYTRKSCGQP
jgi:hypothetical protein